MKYATLLALLLLTGCRETITSEINDGYRLPTGLKDCTIYRMESARYRDVTVVRCPNSTTTTRTHEKHSQNVTVVE